MMKKYNECVEGFSEILESELIEVEASGLGLCIIGSIGGALTGGVKGAAVTPQCPAVGAVIGGLSLGISGGVIGWEK